MNNELYNGHYITYISLNKIHSRMPDVIYIFIFLFKLWMKYMWVLFTILLHIKIRKEKKKWLETRRKVKFTQSILINIWVIWHKHLHEMKRHCNS